MTFTKEEKYLLFHIAQAEYLNAKFVYAPDRLDKIYSSLQINRLVEKDFITKVKFSDTQNKYLLSLGSMLKGYLEEVQQWTREQACEYLSARQIIYNNEDDLLSLHMVMFTNMLNAE